MTGTLDLFPVSGRAAAVEALHFATAIYTAQAVVDDLLDKAHWPRGDRRFLDPAAGDGMMLERAMVRLLRHEPRIGQARVEHLVQGWEVYPDAAAQARERISALLCRHGWGRADAEASASRIVRNRDFLTEGPTEAQFETICSNPPYLRQAGIPPLLREEYAAVTPPYARADLLHAFIDRCARLVTGDGEILLVASDRFLFNLQASKLRAQIGATLAIDHVERLSAETAFYRAKRRARGEPPRIHPVALVLRRPSATSVARLGPEPFFPDAGPPEDAQRTLGDVADVRLAPWLGPMGIHVVDEVTARRLPSAHLVPAVDTDDIVDGRLRTPSRFAIRTFANREPPPEILAHLAGQMHRMPARGRRP